VKGFPDEITITAVYGPPRHNLKNEHFESSFQTLGPEFITRGDYNSKHTLWGSRLTTTKERESSKVIQEKTINFFQLEHQHTGLLTKAKAWIYLISL
jgi:hypothetical protein